MQGLLLHTAIMRSIGRTRIDVTYLLHISSAVHHTRLPSSAKDLPMSFKVQGAQGGARDTPDDYLPSAQTCFFSLALPAYSTRQILKDKLLFAIHNSPNMDADVRLHDAAGWDT